MNSKSKSILENAPRVSVQTLLDYHREIERLDQQLLNVPTDDELYEWARMLCFIPSSRSATPEINTFARARGVIPDFMEGREGGKYKNVSNVFEDHGPKIERNIQTLEWRSVHFLDNLNQLMGFLSRYANCLPNKYIEDSFQFVAHLEDHGLLHPVAALNNRIEFLGYHPKYRRAVRARDVMTRALHLNNQKLIDTYSFVDAFGKALPYIPGTERSKWVEKMVTGVEEKYRREGRANVMPVVKKAISLCQEHAPKKATIFSHRLIDLAAVQAAFGKLSISFDSRGHLVTSRFANDATYLRELIDRTPKKQLRDPNQPVVKATVAFFQTTFPDKYPLKKAGGELGLTAGKVADYLLTPLFRKVGSLPAECPVQVAVMTGRKIEFFIPGSDPSPPLV